jgi:carotenoid cleavage dioxygenase-like enzyme
LIWTGHIAGCYENEAGHIVHDLTVADGNVFFFFPEDGQEPVPPNKRSQLNSPTTRWIFDPSAPSGTRVKPAEVWDTNGEFSRIDDRWVTKKYNHFWQLCIDPSKPYDFAKCGPPAGGLFNTMGRFSWEGRVEDKWFAGPTCTLQEPTFIPKEGGSEGDGWVICLLNHLDVLRNDVLIFESLSIAEGPIAVINLPLKLKLGLHGNWVDQTDIDEWAEKRKVSGEVGPVKLAEKPLIWQEKLMAASSRVPNGVNGHT